MTHRVPHGGLGATIQQYCNGPTSISTQQTRRHEYELSPTVSNGMLGLKFLHARMEFRHRQVQSDVDADPIGIVLAVDSFSFYKRD